MRLFDLQIPGSRVIPVMLQTGANYLFRRDDQSCRRPPVQLEDSIALQMEHPSFKGAITVLPPVVFVSSRQSNRHKNEERSGTAHQNT